MPCLPPHRLRALGLTCASALALTACGGNTVEQSEVEQQVKESLTREVGTAPKAIRCPGDLDAERGRTMRCTLVAPDNSEVDVNLRVTSAEDGKANFDIKVGTEVRR